MRCPECSAPLPPGTTECDACGTPIVGSSGSGDRRIVTVVFADLVDSTGLGERLDPESLHDVLVRYFDVAAASVRRHGGSVRGFFGDSVMAVFGLPEIREDDALRAIRAAQEIRRRVDGVELPSGAGRDRLKVRIAVNSGEILAGRSGAGPTWIFGDAVNVAARLQAYARAGEILLGRSTFELARGSVDVGAKRSYRVKGRRSAVEAFRLLGIRDVPGAGTVFVGRVDELDRLHRSLAEVTRTERALVVMVTGEPGIGKTRLLGRFLSEIGDAAVTAAGRCRSDAAEAPLVPLARAVVDLERQRNAAKDGSPAHSGVTLPRLVRQALGEGGRANADDVRWALIRAVEAAATDQPVVLVLDDVHWAAPGLVEVLELLGGRDARVLIVCLARPEVAETASSLLTSTRRLDLGPLDATAIAALVNGIPVATSLTSVVLGNVVERSSGNPLFARELVYMLGDRHDATERSDRMLMPLSIRALLATRIRSLPQTDADALGRAAVIGWSFAPESLAALTPPGQNLEGTLRRLMRRGFLEETADGAQTHRFHHPLVREVAYDSVSKTERANVHRELVTVLEKDVESEEPDDSHRLLIAHHLEQAYRLRVDLGAVDEATHADARRAADLLHAAGTLALKRGDMAAAAALAERTLPLCGEDLGRRHEAQILLGAALAQSGDIARSIAAYDGAIADAEQRGDRIGVLRGRLERASDLHHIDDPEWLESLRAVTTEVAPELEAAQDHRGLSRLYFLRGLLAWYGDGSAAATERLQSLAIHHAQLGGHEQTASWMAYGLSSVWCAGTTPLDEAIARTRALLQDERAHYPWARSFLLGYAAMDIALAGEPDRGRKLWQRADRLAADGALGWLTNMLQAEQRFWIEIAGWDLDTAAATVQLFVKVPGSGPPAVAMAMYSAIANAFRGRPEQALADLDLWSTGSYQYPFGIALTESARSLALAQLDRADEAVVAADLGLGMSRRTDFLTESGLCYLMCAESSAVLGRVDEMHDRAAEAADLFERKQARSLLETTRRLMSGHVSVSARPA